MSFKDLGFMYVKPGMIAWVEVHDGDSREIVYQPSEEDIIKLCAQYRFDVDKTLDMIRKRDREVHGILFDAEIYRNS